MARRCPCGCGRKLGFNDRSLSKKAAKIGELADNLEHFVVPSLAAAPAGQLRDSIAYGRELREDLIAVIHRDLDAHEVDRDALNEWFGSASSLWNNTKGAARELHRDREPFYE